MFSKKTGLASISEGRSDMFRVNPKHIKVKMGWNGRDFNDPANIEHVDQLAQSIAEIGVKEPLTVSWEDGQAWLVDGECRLRATLRAIEVYKADIKTIPIKTEDRYSNDADKLFSQIIRNSGKPFTAMEQAKVYKRLLDMGWQQNDIAKKAGISAARISQILDLLTMPEPIKAMVTNGQVSASLAQATIRDHNPQVATQVLQDAVATAQADGSNKVRPRHVEVRNSGVEATVKEAFEYCDVDDSSDEIVVIKMPTEQWENIRKALKL
jgi:ParB/RepB/Spo0J family partition protein